MFKFFGKKKDSFAKELDAFLGFESNKIALYKEAFTHPSKKSECNYQRLEFLGDAVLNIIIADYVFRQYPKCPEGELTKLRTKLVNKHILKEVALKLNFQKWIIHELSSAELEKSSVYCDAMESLIGAIYLDKGIKYAEQFVKEKILKHLDEVTEIKDTDYKSQLIQLAQKYRWSLKFNVEKIEKENNENIFIIALYLNNEKISEGRHYSKKQAEQISSYEALKKLNIIVE